MRRAFRFMWVLLPAGCIYLGWVYYSRWSDNRALIQRMEESKAAQDHAVVQAYGGDRLSILDFYAAPGTIRRGEKAQLCYSVSNSTSVRIEPPVQNVWPSLDRCVEVRPRTSTAYKLIAEDAKGHTLTARVMVKVH